MRGGIHDPQPDGNHAPPTDSERLEGVASLACDLLTALQPWEFHGPAVRSAAARLTVALAAIPLPARGGEGNEAA